MKLYLIRHGETEWNIKRLFQGGTDIPLNGNGIRLAELTAKGLADIPFDLVYTSPLSRAKQTAQILVGKRNILILEEPRLREISFGTYEGLCYAKEGYNLPAPVFQNFFDKPEAYIPPEGAESFESLLARTGDFLAEVTSNPALQDKIILLSSHGAAGKAILANIRKLPLSQFWGSGVYKNCAVTIMETDAEGKLTILAENVTYYDEM